MSSSYYDSSGKSVTDGNVANASDLNTINSAVDSGFALVESAIDAIDDAVAIPDGGTTGQVLAKASGNDQDVEWITDHSTTDGDDIDVDTGALTGAYVISDLDFNVTTDTEGHVTDANGAVSTRQLTVVDLDTTATGANLTSLTDGSDASALHVHTVVSLDTDATGTQLTTLTDDSMADALHRHSELSASDGTPNPALSVGTDGKVTLGSGTGINEFSTDDTLAGDSDDAVPTEQAVKAYVDTVVGAVTEGFYDAYIEVVDTQSTGTDGGTAAATTWNVRTITEVADSATIASITDNKLSLPAGTYDCFGWSVAYNCDLNQARLSDGAASPTTVLLGTSQKSSTIDSNVVSIISGTFDIAEGGGTVRLEHYTQSIQSDNGLGIACDSGEDEIFAKVMLWRRA